MIQERDGDNTPLVSYTRGNDLSGTFEGAGGIGGLLARSDGYSGGNWSTHNFYHADGNGNITYLVDSSQALAASYRYDPFGNTISQGGSLADANVYRFSSKEVHSNSGMYYYGYRFYEPNLQRWPNTDPFREPGFELPRSKELMPNLSPNLYLFVGNSPLNLFDALGLSPADVRQIKDAFSNAVREMCKKKKRCDNGYINNICSTFGGGQMGCFDQERWVQTDLERLNLADKWTFSKVSGISVIFPHTWGVGTSQNPTDPSVIFDPWNGKLTLNYPDGTEIFIIVVCKPLGFGA